jgi:hypothetical protein
VRVNYQYRNQKKSVQNLTYGLRRKANSEPEILFLSSGFLKWGISVRISGQADLESKITFSRRAGIQSADCPLPIRRFRPPLIREPSTACLAPSIQCGLKDT